MSKYKRLIYSIPIKYGAQPEDAADIFQAVCTALIAELPRLRRHEALRPWLIRVTRHKTLQWKLRARRESQWPQETAAHDVASAEENGEHLPGRARGEQCVREAFPVLPGRCRGLVGRLFYERPPLPYDEVARRLGLATGSIGFIRGRCLKKLRANLKASGF